MRRPLHFLAMRSGGPHLCGSIWASERHVGSSTSDDVCTFKACGSWDLTRGGGVALVASSDCTSHAPIGYQPKYVVQGPDGCLTKGSAVQSRGTAVRALAEYFGDCSLERGMAGDVHGQISGKSIHTHAEYICKSLGSAARPCCVFWLQRVLDGPLIWKKHASNSPSRAEEEAEDERMHRSQVEAEGDGMEEEVAGDGGYVGGRTERSLFVGFSAREIGDAAPDRVRKESGRTRHGQNTGVI